MEELKRASAFVVVVVVLVVSDDIHPGDEPNDKFLGDFTGLAAEGLCRAFKARTRSATDILFGLANSS
jgi:hypothetical protein